MPLLVSAAAALIAVISFLYLKSYLKRRTDVLFIQDRLLSDIREELNGILRAIDEATDRDISLIEEREKNLKTLLEEIDKRMGVYIRESEKRREADNAYAALSSMPLQKRAALKKSGTGPDEIPAPAFPLPGFSLKPGSGEPSGGKPSVGSSRGEQINQLLRAGFSPQVIASRLGISIAEAEFAAALLERRAITGT
jgi:hypothetical protein